MTTFEDRERAFEAKFSHDEQFRFLVTARRDKLFAQWAAAQLRLGDRAREALTSAVLAVRDGPGHDDRLVKYMGDVFAEHGRNVRGADFASVLTGLAAQAQQQLLDAPLQH